jgi:uncharacterized iron-regulated membrane protein
MRDKRMTAWEQWVHRPQSHWLRGAIFQVHLWTGIAISLYIFVVCLSGSLAVFNSELYTAFLPNPKAVAIVGTRLAGARLRAAAQQAYPATTVTRIVDYRQPGMAVVAYLGGTGVNAKQRFFDPYTAKDIGNARPLGLQMVSWFSQMHMNLMMGYTGRRVNGVGGFLAAALCLTGLVIWWPGIKRWRRSLALRFDTYPKRLNWNLHNFVGFWTFALVFMWAFTGGYLVYPKPFDAAINFLAGTTALHRVNLEQVSHSLHVGNFAGWPVKALWVALGLAPPVLVVTGFLMWWNRVVSPWLARKRLAQRPRVTTASTRTEGFATAEVQGSRR